MCFSGERLDPVDPIPGLFRISFIKCSAGQVGSRREEAEDVAKFVCNFRGKFSENGKRDFPPRLRRVIPNGHGQDDTRVGHIVGFLPFVCSVGRFSLPAGPERS